MCLDRITPTLKPQAMPINLPVVDGLAAQGDKVIKATMGGKIAPDIGSQLITSLASQAKLVEIDDMIKRIEVLEGRHEPKNQTGNVTTRDIWHSFMRYLA